MRLPQLKRYGTGKFQVTLRNETRRFRRQPSTLAYCVCSQLLPTIITLRYLDHSLSSPLNESLKQGSLYRWLCATHRRNWRDLDQVPIMVDYAKKTVAELQEILKARSLSHTGKKAELVARLTEADEEAAQNGAYRSAHKFRWLSEIYLAHLRTHS